MTAINRPPSDITPKEFFENFVPKEFERVAAASAASSPDMSAEVTLSGDGGGTWTLALSGGKLNVTAGAADSPDVAVTQSVEDWRAITVGGDGGPDLTPPDGISIEHWFVNPAIQQALRDAKGTLRFEIPGFGDRTFSATLMFHGAAEPTATISVDADTVAQMRDGSLPAPQAFFAGKIEISGDSAFAMQIGMAVMQPPS